MTKTNSIKRSACVRKITCYVVLLGLIILFWLVTSCLAGEVVVQAQGAKDIFWYNMELVFSDGQKEIARQKTDAFGNLTPISGRVPDGDVKAYSDRGQVMKIIKFKNNMAEGPARSYDPQGKLVAMDTYQQGKLDGIVVGYYPDGTIKTKSVCKDGVYISSQLFDGKGELEMETVHFDQGRVERTFYPNKRIKLERFYKQEELQAIQAKTYSEDGKLLINATKRAVLSDCELHFSKFVYKANEPIDFSFNCRCSGPDDCLAPLEFRNQDSFLQSVVVYDNQTKEYKVFSSQPFDSRIHFFSQYQPWFKHGESIAHFHWPTANGLYRLVGRENLKICNANLQCMAAAWAAGQTSLPTGNYSVWLDTISPAHVNFEVK